MELFFLAVLILLMVGALSSGFPVAFALPGSAILSIGLAALCGWLFAGDPSAYFAQDGPIQWLSAGVTNFRSLYWDVERDTLIAIPLFVFMGIMLQRSKIAEDLLVTMARLFGPVPGGLGISVVFVGALLAATTGIVGATVIAMGLISLPAMLRNNYSKPLATGTICAAGTLGQIIPPSIVLIILADQLSNAADQASAARKAEYLGSDGRIHDALAVRHHLILIGAAMLTSAFRAFGGEELVRHFLTGLPGGFWAQFVVVMAMIFLFGFFLDFIEIAVVVVPIIAPILLADPGANVTAVWLGVMIGLNIQTSFLTPPFGFALFYLRGVAPPSVRTLQMYRGAVAFIVLQLAGLAIAGYFPALVNYLPNRIYLTSDTAPRR